jgi:hypothetical protein
MTDEDTLTGPAGLRVLCADVKAEKQALYGSGIFEGDVPTWEIVKFLDETTTVGEARRRRREIAARVDEAMAARRNRR